MAELFYRRLISVADDFGLCDGRAVQLRGKAFPLKYDQVTIEQVEGWLQECVSAGLIYKYEDKGKPYVRIENFGQRIYPSSRPKFPIPGDGKTVVAATCGEVAADPPQPAARAQTSPSPSLTPNVLEESARETFSPREQKPLEQPKPALVRTGPHDRIHEASRRLGYNPFANFGNTLRGKCGHIVPLPDDLEIIHAMEETRGGVKQRYASWWHKTVPDYIIRNRGDPASRLPPSKEDLRSADLRRLLDVANPQGRVGQ